MTKHNQKRLKMTVIDQNWPKLDQINHWQNCTQNTKLDQNWSNCTISTKMREMTKIYEIELKLTKKGPKVTLDPPKSAKIEALTSS